MHNEKLSHMKKTFGSQKHSDHYHKDLSHWVTPGLWVWACGKRAELSP